MINLQTQPFGSEPAGVASDHFSAESNDQSASAGLLLRQARELSGLDINALAAMLKVPVKKLEALEMDHYDLLLDTVFTRALASSVCRTLKIDTAPVLALLPQAARPFHRQAPLPAQRLFSAYPLMSKPSNRLSLSKPALLAGVMLVVGAAVLIFLPAVKEAAVSFSALGQNSRNGDSVLGAMIRSSAGSSAEGDSAKKVGLLATATPEVASAITVVNNSGRGSAVSSPSTLPMTSATATVTAPVPQFPQVLSSALVPMSAVSLPLALATTVDQPSDRLVTFSVAAQSSWVKVTDAKGEIVLSRTIAPGEAAFAAGSLPLSVVVGRADATRVQVRGQSFDLSSYSNNNVARFEVK